VGFHASVIPTAFSAMIIILWCGLATTGVILTLVVYFKAYRIWQWLRTRLGWGLDLAELAERLGVAVNDLRTVEPSYREVHIPKKRGGQRRLLIPAPELKALQRRVLHRLLKKLRAHPAAHGFEPGSSIVTNALRHEGQRVVIKIDLVDFFPSTSAKRLDAYFRRIGWNAEAAAKLTQICTAEGNLPQGAPSSPRLSNLVNYLMDASIARFVAGRKGMYTRYADDITVSFPKDYPRRIRGVIQRVRRIVKKFGYRIHLRGKLQILRPHQQQRVTGLVVNHRVQLPRKLRRWLRAVEHRMKTRGVSTLSANQLAGWRALQAMIKKQTEDAP
jgi:RNA-directed DNA polymerase